MGVGRAAGGGAVILITDGEESCKGDLQAAAAELQSAGIPLTLEIVGFTVTGQATEAALNALAGAYRIRIEALGQVLEEPLTIEPDQTTVLGLVVEGDQFVIRR